MARRAGPRQGCHRKNVHLLVKCDLGRRPRFLGDVSGIGSGQNFVAERPEQKLLCLEIATAVASKGDELAGKPRAQGAVLRHAIVDELAVHIVDRPIEGLQRLRAEPAAPGGLGQCRSKGGDSRRRRNVIQNLRHVLVLQTGAITVPDRNWFPRTARHLFTLARNLLIPLA